MIGAQQFAECLRREIATLAMLAGDKTIAVTASFGVTAADQADLGVTALIERADEALYRAKRAGKNQSCVAGSVPSSPAPASSPVLATPAITVLRG